MWFIKADADEEHPDTEPTPYLAGHGMEATPVYIRSSNPISQVEISGRALQVYHIKRDNVNVGLPVETELGNFLRNQVVQIDPVLHGIQHPPDRVNRTEQFSWVDTSVGTAKRIFAGIGDNIYNFMNPRKPSS